MRAEVPGNVDTDKLNKAMAEALKEGNTRAIVVAYDSLFMAEMYAEGFDKNTPLLGWSMTKSVTNALVGILVKDGKLDIDAPAPLEAWKNDERKNITLRSLLHMTSGLEWEENYSDISDATVMLYMKGDISGYALNKPAAFPPDSVWYYSSGTTNIISRIIRNTINDDVIYWGFPRDALFNRIGMRTAVMETDAEGTFVGSSYCFASGRDWTRFGLLYLFDGVWNGDTVLPPGWVEFTREQAPHSGGKYGAQFWLNKSGHEIPDAPEDVFFADGYHGQRVYIIPSKRLVIVRLGESKKGEFDYNKFVTSVLDAFE
jgi:CubicO group peptidase (beta-lactamase class C family)